MRVLKKQYRELYYEQMEKDKQLIERHDQMVTLDKKVKKMQKQIKLHLNSAKSNCSADEIDPFPKNHTETNNVTKENLRQLREEIN